MSSTTVQNIGGDRIIIAEQVSPTIGLVYDSTLGTWSPTLSEAGRIANANYVWDTGTLAWVKMTQATGGGGGTGGLTNTELRASPVPVSLSSTTVTGSVAVTGPLTDTQLRASAVPTTDTHTTAGAPLAVRLSDGAAFYNATGGGGGGTSPSTTATKSNVTSAASDTLLLASNTSRLGTVIYNDSNATLYISLGTVTASLTSYTFQCGPGGYYELPFNFTGQIRGVWSSANGAARITELT